MRDALARGFEFRQIHFIEHDERRDACRIAGDEAQVQERFAEGRLGRDDDNCLVDIGGEGFFAPRIGAEQHIAARQHFVNACVAGTGDTDIDFVTAGHILFLALAYANELRAVLEFGKIFAAKIASNERFHRGRYKLSSLAAQMKSFSVIPPASCVE